jgi:hypothetical protein
MSSNPNNNYFKAWTFSREASKNKRLSSTIYRFKTNLKSPNLPNPFNKTLSCALYKILWNTSATKSNNKGERWLPCLTPILQEK